MIKAFIFDFDGVIADTEPVHVEAVNRIFSRFKIHVGLEEWLGKIPGTGYHKAVNTLIRDYNIKTDKPAEFWVKMWKEEFRKLALEGRIRPVKGFLEFNRIVDSYGIKKIVATGSHSENVQYILKSFGLEGQFDVVSVDDTARMKPDPEIFLLAAKRLNVNPGYCIVFEDSVVGVRAARAAGMKCVALTTSFPRKDLEREKPDLIVNDYAEIDIEGLLAK
jgi:beta-phosphoglucomutase